MCMGWKQEWSKEQGRTEWIRSQLNSAFCLPGGVVLWIKKKKKKSQYTGRYAGKWGVKKLMISK